MDVLSTVWFVFVRSHDDPASENKKRKFLLPPGCKDRLANGFVHPGFHSAFATARMHVPVS